MRVLKKSLAILIGVAMIFSPEILCMAQPTQVTQTEHGYAPTVPALGNTETADPGTRPALAQELPNPNDYNSNPLSKPEEPGAITETLVLSQEEKEQVAQLWIELNEAIQSDELKSAFLDFIVKEGSGGPKELAAFAAEFLNALNAVSKEKGVEIISRTRETLLNAPENNNSSFADRLRRLGQQIGSSGVNLGPSSSVMYKPDFSDPLAQKLVAGLRETSAYVKEKISLAKENLKENTVRGTLSTVAQATAPQTNLEIYATASKQDGLQVIDSVEITKQVAAMHALMNPPKSLHPYMRWLLYERHVTSEVVKKYVKARQKMEQIFLKAKAGDGRIRYNGKVCDAYLPLPNELGGTYELIARAVNPK